MYFLLGIDLSESDRNLILLKQARDSFFLQSMKTVISEPRAATPGPGSFHPSACV